MKKINLFVLFLLLCVCAVPFSAKASYTIKTMPIDYEFWEYIHRNYPFLPPLDSTFEEDENYIGNLFVIQSNISGISILFPEISPDRKNISVTEYSEFYIDGKKEYSSTHYPNGFLNFGKTEGTLAFYWYEGNEYMVEDDTALTPIAVYNHPANATLEEILAATEPYPFEVDIFQRRKNLQEVLDACPVWYGISLDGKPLETKALHTEAGMYVPAAVFSELSSKVQVQWDPWKKSIYLQFDPALSHSILGKEYIGSECITYYRNGGVNKQAAQPLLNINGKAMIPYDACNFIWLQEVEKGVIQYAYPAK